MTRESLIQVALETGKDLKFDKVTMRQLEMLALPKVRQLTPAQIKQIRVKAGVSQNVMAVYLNVSPSTYQKWERGEVTPYGGNMKLLNMVYKKGLEAIA
ncbi:MAG: putative transcriptional regulator [Gammaproteobacteria bacterium]|jgi:putative transcriptional regulator